MGPEHSGSKTEEAADIPDADSAVQLWLLQQQLALPDRLLGVLGVRPVESRVAGAQIQNPAMCRGAEQACGLSEELLALAGRNPLKSAPVN